MRKSFAYKCEFLLRNVRCFCDMSHNLHSGLQVVPQYEEQNLNKIFGKMYQFSKAYPINSFVYAYLLLK